MTLARTSVLLLLVGIVGATVAGCSSGPSKQEAQARQFSGTWELFCVRADNTGCKSPDVRFEIEEGEGRKPYRLVRTDGEETVIGEGTIEIGSRNRLRMTGDFTPTPLLWRFDFGDFPDSVRLILQPRFEDDSRRILDVLDLTGGRDRVEMDLRQP